jgi:hypothetical protein
LPRFENIDINVDISLDDDIIDAKSVCTNKRVRFLQTENPSRSKAVENFGDCSHGLQGQAPAARRQLPQQRQPALRERVARL